MDAFIFYLLKSATWLTGFTLVYYLFLRGERYFRLKIFYLMSGIIIAIIFPLVTLHYKVELTPAVILSGNPAPAPGNLIETPSKDVAASLSASTEFWK